MSLTAIVSIGHVALSWAPPSSNGGSPITRYDIYRDGAGRPFRSVTTRSYTDSVGNGATHQYRVTAVNAVGSSAYSKVVTGTTPNVPGIPGNPQAQGGAGQIVLTWLAPASNGSPITRYDIYRDGAVTPTYSVTTPSKTDTGLAAGTTYTYIVKAVNAVGPSAGGLAFATTASAPGAPASLSATAGAGQILLTWFAPASDGRSPITRYDIYRDGAGTPTYTTTTTSYTNTGLAAGTTYTYIVKATNAAGSSLGSSAAATTANVPGAPTSLGATGGVGQVVLSWSAPSSNGNPITRYDIYREGILIGTSASPGYTDSPLPNGVSHSYYVKAANAVGEGAQSNTASATTASVPGAPATVTATGGNGQITVTWTAPISNGGAPVTSYQVYRDGGFSPICSGLAQPCTDSGLPGGVTHTYTVRARNIVGEGPGTSASAITWNVPAAPGYFTATGGVGRITLSWSAPANNGSAITRYDIYRDGAYFDFSPSPGYTDSPLGPGASHSYYVRAHNAVGDSAASNTATAATANYPDAPVLNSASIDQIGQVSLDWSPAAGNGSAITKYYVYRDGTQVGQTSAGVTSFVDAVGPGTYVYTITAWNGVGEGNASNPVTGISP